MRSPHVLRAYKNRLHPKVPCPVEPPGIVVDDDGVVWVDPSVRGQRCVELGSSLGHAYQIRAVSLNKEITDVQATQIAIDVLGAIARGRVQQVPTPAQRS